MLSGTDMARTTIRKSQPHRRSRFPLTSLYRWEPEEHIYDKDIIKRFWQGLNLTVQEADKDTHYTARGDWICEPFNTQTADPASHLTFVYAAKQMRAFEREKAAETGLSIAVVKKNVRNVHNPLSRGTAITRLSGAILWRAQVILCSPNNSLHFTLIFQCDLVVCALLTVSDRLPNTINLSGNPDDRRVPRPSTGRTRTKRRKKKRDKGRKERRRRRRGRS